MDQLTFAGIAWGSAEYERAIDLRNRTLRIPLGLKLSSLDQQAEREQLHFGVFANEKLIGTVTVVALENASAKIRQMVVEPPFQRTGIGKFLMTRVEEELVRLGKRCVTLHARKSAIGFYQKLGYQTQGEEFLEVTIPHMLMTKSIG